MLDFINTLVEKKVRKSPSNMLINEMLDEYDISTQEIAELARELKAAQLKALRYSTMLSSVIDTMPGMVWGKRLNGTFFLTNKQLRDRLLGGISVDESIEDDVGIFEEMTKRGDTLHIDCQRTDSMVVRNNASMDFIERGYVGNRLVILRSSKAPFKDCDGNIIGTVGFGREVTDICKLVNSSIAKAKKAMRTCPTLCENSKGMLEILREAVDAIEGEYCEQCYDAGRLEDDQ